jgi:hypothetical protein
MQTATVRPQRPRIKRVIRLSSARSQIGHLCSLSFASVEKPASRKKPNKRVIEKLLPAAPKAASPKVVRTRSIIDSHLAESLFSDVKAIFRLKKPAQQLRTQVILDALCADKKKPWATFCNGNPIGPRQLASLLMPYGIHSRDLRFSGSAFKGYRLEWFQDADRSAN